jgi:hypothetical protein
MKENYELIRNAIDLLYKVDQTPQSFDDYENYFLEAIENLEYIAEELRLMIVRKEKTKL